MLKETSFAEFKAERFANSPYMPFCLKSLEFSKSCLIVGLATAAIAAATCAFLALSEMGPLQELSDGANIAIGVCSILTFLKIWHSLKSSENLVYISDAELLTLEDYISPPGAQYISHSWRARCFGPNTNNVKKIAIEGYPEFQIRPWRSTIRSWMTVCSIGLLCLTVGILTQQGKISEEIFSKKMADEMLWSGVGIACVGGFWAAERWHTMRKHYPKKTSS